MKKFSLTILIVTIILFTSVGYSALVSDLSVTDISVGVRLDSDVRVSKIEINSLSEGVVSNFEDYNTSNMIASVNLPNADSYIIYSVNVTNYGNSLMGIRNITLNNESLKYELLNNFELGDTICNSSDSCTLGATKTIKIKISYNDYDSSNITQLLRLDFDFATYFSVTYDSISNNDYPVNIIENGTLVVNFTENFAELSVTKGGLVLTVNTDYTYSNNVLTIPNVDGNIKISSLKLDLIDQYYPPAGETLTYKGITYTSYGHGVYEIDGTNSSNSNAYVRITRTGSSPNFSYFQAASSWSSFSKVGATPILEANTLVNFKITHISGSYSNITAVERFKLTFRTFSSLSNIATIGYDFCPTSSGTYLGNGTLGVGVDSLAFYVNGSGVKQSFDHYKFKISIMTPSEEDSGGETTQEPDAVDISGCPSITSDTGELTVTRCSDGLIDLTSDGPIISSYYIFATKSLLKIGTSGKELYDSSLALNPRFKTNDNVSLVYQYVRGMPLIAVEDSLNFVLRDTSTSMNSLYAPKIMCEIGGTNCKNDLTLTSLIDKDAVDVSIYLTNSISLDHYQFYLNDRIEQ